MAFVHTSCSKDEIEFFDSNHYIYFNESIGSGENYPSLSYTFTFQDSLVKNTTYNVPVKLAGRFINQNATFEWKVVDSLTTAIANVHYKILDTKQLFIPANDSIGGGKIQLLRTADMTTQSYDLVLQLVPNQNFKVGRVDKIKITITDKLVKPDWWVYYPYTRYFGTYSPTKLRLWLEFMGVTDGSNPFETSTYILWLDYGTGNYIYKSYKEAEVKAAVIGFRNWLRDTKGNPYDEDLKSPVSESLGSY